MLPKTRPDAVPGCMPLRPRVRILVPRLGRAPAGPLAIRWRLARYCSTRMAHRGPEALARR
jgi:hypothetical protein